MHRLEDALERKRSEDENSCKKNNSRIIGPCFLPLLGCSSSLQWNRYRTVATTLSLLDLDLCSVECSRSGTRRRSVTDYFSINSSIFRARCGRSRCLLSLPRRAGAFHSDAGTYNLCALTSSPRRAIKVHQGPITSATDRQADRRVFQKHKRATARTRATPTPTATEPTDYRCVPSEQGRLGRKLRQVDLGVGGGCGEHIK